MKLQFKQIEPFVKNPPADTLAVLVYGPDEGLMRERADILTKHIVNDPKDPFLVTDISADRLAVSPSLLTDEVQAMSMLGGRKVVKLSLAAVDGDGLRKVENIVAETLGGMRPGDNFLLVEAGDLKPSSKIRTGFEAAPQAVALPCYVGDERDISRLIAEDLTAQGFKIERDALDYMTANIVGDRAVARGEVEKLITYMGKESRVVRLDDVTAAIGDSAELSIDIIAKTAAMGDFAAADRILRHLCAEGINAVSISRVLQNYFLRLHITKMRVQAREPLEAAMKSLRPPVFWKHKDAFVAQVNAFSPAQLEQALQILYAAELKCKQGATDAETILSRALLSISHMAARARGQRRYG